MSMNLLGNIPEKDFLGLFENGHPQGPVIVELLGYAKIDVSSVAGVERTSVRWDRGRMPQAVLERLTEWATALNLVAGFFEGDRHKTGLWFKTPNPALGYVRPRDMIRMGRYDKLYSFIMTALDENKAPAKASP